MLILGLDGLDAVQIGKDIVIGIHKKGNKWKLSIVAPKSLKINRIGRRSNRQGHCDRNTQEG